MTHFLSTTGLDAGTYVFWLTDNSLKTQVYAAFEAAKDDAVKLAEEKHKREFANSVFLILEAVAELCSGYPRLSSWGYSRLWFLWTAIPELTLHTCSPVTQNRMFILFTFYSLFIEKRLKLKFAFACLFISVVYLKNYHL